MNHIFDKNICERWFGYAAEMLKLAKEEKKSGSYLWCYYKLHRCAEYIIKGLLRSRGVYSVSISSLVGLNEELKSIGIETPGELGDCFKMMDAYYILPGESEAVPDVIDIDIVDEAQVCAERLIEFSKGIVGD